MHYIVRQGPDPPLIISLCTPPTQKNHHWQYFYLSLPIKQDTTWQRNDSNIHLTRKRPRTVDPNKYHWSRQFNPLPPPPSPQKKNQTPKKEKEKRFSFQLEENQWHKIRFGKENLHIPPPTPPPPPPTLVLHYWNSFNCSLQTLNKYTP